MLNYRLISINLDIIVSATICYVFIRIHVESFNVVYEPCHGETYLRFYIHDNGLTFVRGALRSRIRVCLFG